MAQRERMAASIYPLPHQHLTEMACPGVIPAENKLWRWCVKRNYHGRRANGAMSFHHKAKRTVTQPGVNAQRTGALNIGAGDAYPGMAWWKDGSGGHGMTAWLWWLAWKSGEGKAKADEPIMQHAWRT
jgi:hypothetical protein